MSHASASTREFDFWEFVNCSRCHLPFAAEAGAPSVPFWLTECGHVICNNHLNADQSCAQCGERGIQLMPLQRDMELPMSDWFRSAPSALDSIAFSTRFQMDTLASLVRHYKKKYSHQRLILERLKGEYKNLKRTVEDLQAENEQIRRYAEYGQGTPSDIRNDNGKRRMLDSHYHPNGARTSSSPRSIVTPVGPDRLTLPPDHQQPTFTSRRASHSDDPSQAFQDQSGRQQRDRPGSRRFAQQYAYMPPQTPQTREGPIATLSHAQTAPTRQAQARQVQDYPNLSNQPHTSMMPPLATRREVQVQMINQDFGTLEGTAQRGHQRQQMPPPPVPQSQKNGLQQRDSFHLLGSGSSQPKTTDASSLRRFVPPTPARTGDTSTSSRRLLQKPTRQHGFRPQPFLPPAQTGGLQGLSGVSIADVHVNQTPVSVLKVSSRAPSVGMPGGQRMPFVLGS